jgi:hypothetical protein
MCGMCRSGRRKLIGFGWYRGRLSHWYPGGHHGEGDPYPWIWFAFWRLDLLLSPAPKSWQLRYDSDPYLLFVVCGPFEFNYLRIR